MNARLVRQALALAVALLALPGVALAASLTVNSSKLTVYRSCALTAYPTASTTDIDAYVDQTLATTNAGTATTLSEQSSNLANRRPYLKFDLTKCNPSIASTATIKLATLRLYVTAVASNCRTVDIFKVTSSWTETGITWNTQPFGTSVNNPASSSRTDAITVGTGGGCTNTTANTYVSGWNVTADVSAFVAGTSTNFGWMIRDDSENQTVLRVNTFSSREASNVAQGPQLIVTYTT